MQLSKVLVLAPVMVLTMACVSLSARAETPIVIDGLLGETLFLPHLGEVLVEGTGVIEPAAGELGINAKVGAVLVVDGGRIETISANAIRTQAHSNITIINGAQLLTGTNTSLSLSERATVLVRDSVISDNISADDGLRLEIIDSSFGGNVRGGSDSRTRLVNTSSGRLRFDDEVVVDVINSEVFGRLQFNSNVVLFVDEDSVLHDQISADHNLDLDMRGILLLDENASNLSGIGGNSNFNVHLRGASITALGSGHRGFGIGQAGTIRLSEGASIEATSHAIEMSDSGTVIIEPGSLVSSTQNASIRHLNGLQLSVNESSLIGRIEIGRASIVSIHDSTVAGDDRGIRVEQGSRVTLSGASTSISAQSGRVIDLGDGSLLTMLDGAISAPASATCARGISLDSGAEARIHGGSIHFMADGCTGVRGSRGRVRMDGGSLTTEGDNAPGIYFFTQGWVNLSGDASITTTGDRGNFNADGGAHGVTARASVVEMDGGQINVHGSDNFGLLGIEDALIVLRDGQVLADASKGSYSLGSFSESVIRILGLADDFTIDIDGSGDGPQPVTLKEGGSVDLADLHPEFADETVPFSGVIAGTWPSGQAFALSFSNQNANLPPGQIILRGMAEPDPGTETVMESQTNPSESGEVVVFVVEVSNPNAAPDDGQVLVTASSGESCHADTPSASGNTATYTCEIVFETVGSRGVSAHFSGSGQFEDSSSAPLTQVVTVGLFIDRFEEVNPGRI
ncbi:MAG: hypothetical protein EA370_14875 [Wenzhouxiangella sp.]|nr:MAG: hypothetical protein EA370_14875 [Wenzhouxiangella sp.]